MKTIRHYRNNIVAKLNTEKCRDLSNREIKRCLKHCVLATKLIDNAQWFRDHKEIRECIWCGNIFSDINGQGLDFCSKDCGNSYNRAGTLETHNIETGTSLPHYARLK